VISLSKKRVGVYSTTSSIFNELNKLNNLQTVTGGGSALSYDEPSFSKIDNNVLKESELIKNSLNDLKLSYELAKTDKERFEITKLMNEVKKINEKYGYKVDEKTLPHDGKNLAKVLSLVNIELENVPYYLNATERVLSVDNKIKVGTALVDAFLARESTREKYNDPNNVGGEPDAFRHMLWSALLTYHTDKSFAKLFTNAHEYGYYTNLQTDKAYNETITDFHNNELGINIGDKRYNPDYYDIELIRAVNKIIEERKHKTTQ
jgi:hypothetical protein